MLEVRNPIGVEVQSGEDAALEADLDPEIFERGGDSVRDVIAAEEAEVEITGEEEGVDMVEGIEVGIGVEIEVVEEVEIEEGLQALQEKKV